MRKWCSIPVSGRPGAMTSGAFPSVDSIFAPISRSGSMTRPIGRDDSDSSPVSVAPACRPAKTPLNRRIVVPLFPQSSGISGGVKGPPAIVTSESKRVMSIPSELRHASVEPQSALAAKLLISETPFAIAAIIAARCEIDLSPGRRSEPDSFLAG